MSVAIRGRYSHNKERAIGALADIPLLAKRAPLTH